MVLAGLTNPTSLFSNKRASLQVRFKDIVYSIPGPKKGLQTLQYTFHHTN